MCVEDDIVDFVENDRINMLVLENNKVARIDETSTKTQEGKHFPLAEKSNQNPITYEELDKSKDYDIFLNVLIALRKDTRSCTKYTMYSFLAYNNFSSEFDVFTASLDTVTISKNIHMTMKIPTWKASVMEGIGALEMNNT